MTGVDGVAVLVGVLEPQKPRGPQLDAHRRAIAKLRVGAREVLTVDLDKHEWRKVTRLPG